MNSEDELNNPSNQKETAGPNIGLIAFIVFDFVVTAGLIWYFFIR